MALFHKVKRAAKGLFFGDPLAISLDGWRAGLCAPSSALSIIRKANLQSAPSTPTRAATSTEMKNRISRRCYSRGVTADLLRLLPGAGYALRTMERCVGLVSIPAK